VAFIGDGNASHHALPPYREGSAVMERRGFEQTGPTDQRLENHAKLDDEARGTPAARDDLIRGQAAFVARTTAAQVNEYRAYTVGIDGHFTASRAFTCANDADAIVWAKQLVDGHDVELWSGERFIIKLEHQEK
jgi:hypothetical protein